MIDIDLSDGPGARSPASLDACLSSVTEGPLTTCPTSMSPREHLLSAYKSWLAGRGSWLVPIHDPRTFPWAGYWFAIINGSDRAHADGLQHQVAVLAFGTPPGVVLSPQDPDLLGRATADLDISSAYAVASLDPCCAATPAMTTKAIPGSCTGTAPGTARPASRRKRDYARTRAQLEPRHGWTVTAARLLLSTRPHAAEA